MMVYVKSLGLPIDVDLAGILGGRMASAEGGSHPEVAYGEGNPLSVMSSPSGVRSRAKFWETYPPSSTPMGLP